MPLYIINIEKDIAQGPFETKTDLATAFDDDTDHTCIVLSIDESGEASVLGDAAEYLEDDSDTELAS